jgi:hypothetical protein
MQNELGDSLNPSRHGGNPPKPNRWVPVEVWQSKGLTAQEMTLPQGKRPRLSTTSRHLRHSSIRRRFDSDEFR